MYLSGRENKNLSKDQRHSRGHKASLPFSLTFPFYFNSTSGAASRALLPYLLLSGFIVGLCDDSLGLSPPFAGMCTLTLLLFFMTRRVEPRLILANSWAPRRVFFSPRRGERRAFRRSEINKIFFLEWWFLRIVKFVGFS